MIKVILKLLNSLPNLTVPRLGLKIPHTPGFRALIPDLIAYDLAHWGFCVAQVA